MNNSARAAGVSVSADGRGLVSQAGAVLLWETMRVTGLARGLADGLALWRAPRAVHDPGKIVADCAVLLADGTVYTWGFNAYGELGDGTTTERLTPVLVPGLSGSPRSPRAPTTRWPREPAGSSGPGGATITGS